MTRHGEALAYFREHLHDETDDCMIWPYSVQSSGYGQLFIDGRCVLVPVLACEAHHGPRPPGLEMAHGQCHNRRCWNGTHLSWKTRAENAADRHRDGTGRTTGLLTAEVVRSIRSDFAEGITQRVLAEQHGVTQPTISSIIHRRTWAQV